jgi:UDP-2,3-diacylglucosamine pyrophosphatase LpxH
MPQIKYVIFSDMHLGANNSLLTNLNPDSLENEPLKASPVLIELTKLFREIITPGNKPTLILNGDILEIALADTNDAVMAFDRFIELLFPQEEDKQLFDKKIFYLPGNHDHHIWEIARETQYSNYIKTIPLGALIPPPWHTTKMSVEDNAIAVPSIFLNDLIHRYQHLKDIQVEIVYPNLGLIKDDKKCVIIHHGHFVESLYWLMSELLVLIFPDHSLPKDVYELEAENFAWIDFFWSTLGRSGLVGKQVELIYELLQKPEKFKELIINLNTGIDKELSLPGVLTWLINKKISIGFDMFDKLRPHPQPASEPLSVEIKRGLENYLQFPLLGQLITEFKKVPDDITFVFGHTHEPFEQELEIPGFSNKVKILNSGGWVVDTTSFKPLHGGAVILIDEDNNVISLRIYNEAESSDKYAVKVEKATGAYNDFYNEIQEKIAKFQQSEAGKSFNETLANEVDKRYRALTKKIET